MKFKGIRLMYGNYIEADFRFYPNEHHLSKRPVNLTMVFRALKYEERYRESYVHAIRYVCDSVFEFNAPVISFFTSHAYGARFKSAISSPVSDEVCDAIYKFQAALERQYLLYAYSFITEKRSKLWQPPEQFDKYAGDRCNMDYMDKILDLYEDGLFKGFRPSWHVLAAIRDQQLNQFGI